MTNRAAPTMNEVFRDLTVGRKLAVTHIAVKADHADLTFGDAVREIPKDLPKAITSAERTVPIVYHTPEHH